jgi:cytochrome P450
MAHDEEVYPDPFSFDPSRHVGDKPQVDPFKFAFGFGRRVCPGAHLAEISLFLNIANILAVFNISKPVDKDGKPIEPVIRWNNGVTSSVNHS